MKQFTVVLALVFLSFFNAHAQENAADTTKRVFEKVEIEAGYPGGIDAWRRFLEKNLNARVPIKNEAPAGKFTVFVQFIVNKDGSVSDIKALTDLGYGMEQEVIRIIGKSGNWTPAQMNGRAVKAYRKQPVTFMVEDENFAIITKKQFILYTNTDNLFSVQAGKVKNENLRVTISEGSIVSKGNGQFIARVNKPGRVIIELFDTRKNKKIGAASFEVLKENENR
jgi:hypothetical protein